MYKKRNISFFICLLFSINFANASTLKLKGLIGNYPISMELNIETLPKNEGSIIKGEYSYDKYKTPIELDGRIDPYFNFMIVEGTGKFKLEGEWDCRWSGLSGDWTSDDGNKLPVKLSILFEETNKISKSGEEYKIIREINKNIDGNESTSTFLLIGKNKVKTEANCDGDVGHSDISVVEINSQKLHKVFWRVDSTGQGVIDDGNIAYLHANGSKIVGGVSGYKLGWDEYSKESCEFSLLNDDLVRTCIQESLLPNDNIFTYKEEKKVELYSVTEEGFKKLATEFSNRGLEEVVEQPHDLMRTVENMPWEFISN